MALHYVFILSFGLVALSVNLSAAAFAPQRYPLDWLECGGWACFCAAIILWGLARA